MKRNLDVIDRLDGVDGYVKLVLSNGQIEFGYPDTIFYDEDEEGWETIKRIFFQPYYSQRMVDYGVEDIESFEPIDEKDIPPYE